MTVFPGIELESFIKKDLSLKPLKQNLNKKMNDILCSNPSGHFLATKNTHRQKGLQSESVFQDSCPQQRRFAHPRSIHYFLLLFSLQM